MDAEPNFTSQEILYQGRKTSRQGSEQRRKAILQATLRVLVKDGVRGVRHRAVAKEAEVPLSATTYYFKDIHDLLADAFTFYAQENLDTLVVPFWDSAQKWVQANYAEPRNQQERQVMLVSIIDHMGDAGADYILRRISTHRERILIEQAFRYAALQDERLHTMAVQHGKRLSQAMTEMLRAAHVAEPQLAASSIIDTVRRLEYEWVMTSSPDKGAIKQALVFQVTAVTRS